MRRWVLPLLLFSATASAEPVVDTIVVDIHARGATGVAALKSQATVLWSVEFGNEMLLGVAGESRAAWLAQPDTRAGPSGLTLDSLRVRDHVCTLHDAPPALDVVGGYEILRAEKAWEERGLPLHVLGQKVPDDGIVAREVNNLPERRGTLAVDPDILAVTQKVDGQRWFQSVADLAGFNRNSFSPQLTTARSWILGEFAAAGLTTETFLFPMSGSSCSPTVPNTTLGNPIGRKIGITLPDEWLVVGGHYDSRNSVRCDGTAQPQPGANDNASGCAGVIELARVFQNVRTDRSILFMCFAGEEQGLQGSREYVNVLLNSGDIAKVKHMINLDMIGHAIDDTLSARVETTSAHSALLGQYADVAATYAPELNLIVSAATQGYSDHWYFLQRGVPSVFTWENGAGIYPDYHQVSDTPANMQRAPQLAAGILKMDAARLAMLAGLPGMFGDGFE